MLRALIEIVSDHPGLFLFCRRILEGNFATISQIIKEKLPADPQRQVLDVACGPGAFSGLFSPESYSGVDLNARYIQYAKRHYRGRFEAMDARKLEFADESFDDALVFGLLHHLSDEDARAVLTSLSRVLKPGGRALVIEDIPTESRLNLVGHLLHQVENGHFIRPAEQYRRLLSAHLRPEEEQIFRSGICDYYMACVSNDGALETSANSGQSSDP